jgi:hypothetical protein
VKSGGGGDGVEKEKTVIINLKHQRIGNFPDQIKKSSKINNKFKHFASSVEVYFANNNHDYNSKLKLSNCYINNKIEAKSQLKLTGYR